MAPMVIKDGTQMTTPVERTRLLLDGLGASAEIRVLAQPAPTAQSAADQLGCPVGAIANSLVFAAGGDAVLVLASGAHRVDVKKLARLLGVQKVRRADPKFVHQMTGQHVGGVAPIGHAQPLKTIIDETLSQYPVVWAGAGTEDSLFATTALELSRITGGSLASVAAE